MNRSVVIVGGGIAGLSAGCYARMCGYEAVVLEAHTVPGGLCASWQRQGYTFDGCIHWLTGARPGSPFFDFWLAGMWVQSPGGLPVALKSGRDAVQLLCRADGRRFTTSFPEA